MNSFLTIKYNRFIVFLLYIDKIGIIAGFFEPSQKYNFYAPLQNFSLGIDYKLFGLNPTGFYWHHLLSLSVVIILAYLVLSVFFPPFLASMIVSLFVVAIPTTHITHFLMVRHYVEGLLLSLLAILAYLQAIKTEKIKWALVGSILYLLATMAKELYVPLVIALIWLPIKTFKIRLHLLKPYIVIAIFYVLLRIYMLGENILSGYAQQTTTWLDIVNFPVTFINVMGWQELWQWSIILIIMSIFAITIWYRITTVGLYSLAWFGLLFLPLIPIMWRILVLPYYLFVFTLLFCVCCGIALNQLVKFLTKYSLQNIVTGCFLALLLTNLLPVQTEQANLYKNMQAKKIQGEFLLSSRLSSTVFIYDYYVAASLIYLRDNVIGNTEGVKWCPKNDCLCAFYYSGYNAKQYIDGQWHTKILLAKPTSAEECGDQTKELSIFATFISPTNVHWQFGSYPQGRYYISTSLDSYGQLSSSPILTEIPPQGIYNFFDMTLSSPLKFIVKYVSPEGWETYSPLLVLDPKQTQNSTEINWHRP